MHFSQQQINSTNLAYLNKLFTSSEIQRMLVKLSDYSTTGFTDEEIQIALAKWFANFLDDVSQDICYWIEDRALRQFEKYLPFDRLQDEAAIEEGYDYESTYEAMSNDPDFIASMEEIATRDYQLYLSSK